MHQLLNRVRSHNVFPCIISAICSSCRILITDAPAKQSMEKHEDQVTKAAYVTTSKSSPGNYVLHAFRHTAVYPLDQAFSVLSDSSQEEQVTMYLLEDDRERRNLEVLNNAMTVIPDGNVTPFGIMLTASEKHCLRQPGKKS